MANTVHDLIAVATRAAANQQQAITAAQDQAARIAAQRAAQAPQLATAPPAQAAAGQVPA